MCMHHGGTADVWTWRWARKGGWWGGYQGTVMVQGNTRAAGNLLCGCHSAHAHRPFSACSSPCVVSPRASASAIPSAPTYASLYASPPPPTPSTPPPARVRLWAGRCLDTCMGTHCETNNPAAVMLMSLRANLQASGAPAKPVAVCTLSPEGAAAADSTARCTAVAWVPRSDGGQFVVASSSGNIYTYKKVGGCGVHACSVCIFWHALLLGCTGMGLWVGGWVGASVRLGGPGGAGVREGVSTASACTGRAGVACSSRRSRRPLHASKGHAGHDLQPPPPPSAPPPPPWVGPWRVSRL